MSYRQLSWDKEMIAFTDMYFCIKEQKLKGRGTCRESDIEVNLLSYPDSSANYKLKENHLAVRDSNYKGKFGLER